MLSSSSARRRRDWNPLPPFLCSSYCTSLSSQAIEVYGEELRDRSGVAHAVLHGLSGPEINERGPISIGVLLAGSTRAKYANTDATSAAKLPQDVNKRCISMYNIKAGCKRCLPVASAWTCTTHGVSMSTGHAERVNSLHLFGVGRCVGVAGEGAGEGLRYLILSVSRVLAVGMCAAI